MKIDMGHIVLGGVIVGMYIHQLRQIIWTTNNLVEVVNSYLNLSTLFSELLEEVVDKNPDLLVSEKLQNALTKFKFNDMMQMEDFGGVG